MRRIQKPILYIILAFFVGIVLTLSGNMLVQKKTSRYISDAIEDLPQQNVALVLGTNSTLSGGGDNPYFYNRIDAAAALFKSGKASDILVSGDNRKEHYNEPEVMKAELIERGIPENHIYTDFAGFRTLDSVVRAKEVFGLSSFIVVSQKFHNERAVYIARFKGIDAYGYDAKDVPISAGFMTRTREYLARDKMFLDLLLHIQPHFLGEKVEIT